MIWSGRLRSLIDFCRHKDNYRRTPLPRIKACLHCIRNAFFSVFIFPSRDIDDTQIALKKTRESVNVAGCLAEQHKESKVSGAREQRIGRRMRMQRSRAMQVPPQLSRRLFGEKNVTRI